jgi:hypothetical protein
VAGIPVAALRALAAVVVPVVAAAAAAAAVVIRVVVALRAAAVVIRAVGALRAAAVAIRAVVVALRAAAVAIRAVVVALRAAPLRAAAALLLRSRASSKATGAGAAIQTTCQLSMRLRHERGACVPGTGLATLGKAYLFKALAGRPLPGRRPVPFSEQIRSALALGS